MLSLLNASSWFAQYGLLIVLVVALVALMLISFNRKKKEDTYRNELSQKVVPGAMVKTYYGLYGKVLKVTETNEGKVLLLETGEGNKISYQTVHINAIYAIDEKKEIVLDENGNDITDVETNKKFEELEKELDKKQKQTKETKKIKSETEQIVEEFVKENKTEKPAVEVKAIKEIVEPEKTVTAKKEKKSK